MAPASDVRTLLDALGHEGDRREAAIARLTILGSRVVPRLLEELGSTRQRDIRVAILRVLEGVADERALDAAARAATTEGGDVAVAAVAVLRELLGQPARSTDVKALDALLAIAKDAGVDRRVRAAAHDALQDAPADVRQALDALGSPEPAELALWQDALGGHLPDDPRQLRSAISTHASDAALPDLRRLIEALGARERAEQKAAVKAEWRAVRGAVHQALALRGSRVALYDLRESFEQADGPLPSSFIAAVNLIGDESCVEPLAAAYTKAGEDPQWKLQVSQAFHDLVKRERITKRHSALRRALVKAPDLGG